jgi:hypothetical protein
MSLLDALLLDPAPFNVWIAIRTDGLKGSGTATDPYDGSARLATALSITLTRSGSTATASLSAGHGLQNGDSVVISGATGADASLWNGVFTISNVGSTSFQYTMNSSPASSPATGTITVAKVTGKKFDDVMSGLSANTRVHLGPGTFLTQGYAYNVSGEWQVKAGMKIIGSGMEVTTLQLVNHTASEYYFAIGHDISAGAKVDFTEVSDLTINCNLVNAGASTSCSAVRLMGEHARIFRVRAINWGSKDSAKPCSVLSCITALPDSGVSEVAHSGMDECVVVSPDAGNIAACTALSAGNPDNVSFVADGHGKAPYIRNCFVDCGVTTPNPDPTVGKYRGLAMGWCRGGVVEGNHVYNADIGGPFQDNKSSARDIIVRNNFYKNVGRGPYWNLGTLGAERAQGFSSLLGRSGTVGTVTNLSSFDDYDAGVRVKLVTSPADYTGLYVIQSKMATSFTVTVQNTGSSVVTVTSARKIFGISRAIIEGNIIELAAVSGATAIAVADNNDTSPYSELPDYVHGDVIVRNNKIRYVDGAAPNDGGATLMELKGAKNIIVQNNVLDTIATAPLVNKRCGNGTYFNNRTPSGALLQGWNSDTSRKYDELETEAEDALVMSMFNER